MDENVRLLLQLFIYILLIPIVFKSLKATRLEEIFKKGHSRYIIVFYVIVTLTISKVLGDLIFFFVDFGNNLGI